RILHQVTHAPATEVSHVIRNGTKARSPTADPSLTLANHALMRLVPVAVGSMTLSARKIGAAISPATAGPARRPARTESHHGRGVRASTPIVTAPARATIGRESRRPGTQLAATVERAMVSTGRNTINDDHSAPA